MSGLTDTYLAWDELGHAPECADPRWIVDVRTEFRAFRDLSSQSHNCPSEGCGHSDRYEKTSVRIVCRSCGKARIMSGESDSLRQTSTTALGYGQQPRKTAGLWLYPGEPLLYGWGSVGGDEPTGYLATRTRVDRVTGENVIGAIYQERGPRRGIKWAATAIVDAFGEYGYGQVRWARSQNGLPTKAAAAKWIATADQEKDTAATVEATSTPEDADE
ncbi:hypothetical protein ACIRJR_09540 [Streptomyces sp. NPDC102402]|uniref:hypothetical protein n=1 Tax=Streptomyces sp. NPDC102402 TaxID=3366169 RepID=UPI0037FE4593